jgi:hypothetical protein
MVNYYCEKCEYKTEKKSSYVNHNKSKKHMAKHKGEEKETKKIICDVCEKVFKHRSGLSRHKKTHEENNKIKCVLCNMGFRDNSNLTRHYGSRQHCQKLSEIYEKEISNISILEHTSDEILKMKQQIRKDARQRYGSALESVKKTEIKNIKQEVKPEVKTYTLFTAEDLDELLYTNHTNKESKKLVSKLLLQLKDQDMKRMFMADMEDEEADYIAIKEDLIDCLMDEMK